MRILVLGQYGFYRSVGYSTTTCLIAREWEISKALVARGHRVYLTGGPENDSMVDGVRIVGRTGLPLDPVCLGDGTVSPWAEKYDAIVGLTEFAWNWIVGSTTDPKAFLRHPNFVYWCDGWLDHAEMGHARAIAGSTPNVSAELRRRYPWVEHLVLPWAITEPLEMPPRPKGWEEDRKRIVYCGFLEERIIRILNQVAEADIGEVWVGGCWNGPGHYTGFRDEERATMFHPRIRWISDVADQRVINSDEAPRCRLDPQYPHGPVEYGVQFPFYAHADVNLCFAREKSRRGVFTSKLYDQIGSGTPTVCEQHVQNAGNVVNLGAGDLVPYDDAERMIGTAEAFVDTWTPADRLRLRAESRAFGTWADRARVLEAYLLE